MADYYSIITNRGKELEAEALASGRLIVLTHFVVGDSNGKQVKPDPAQIRLINETYRGDIAELVVSPEQSTQLMAKIVLPTGIGGFTVREVGLMTDAGELYAVANCPSIDKPVGGVSVNMQFRLAVSDTTNITLNVATGDGLFLRIDQNLKEIKARGAEAQKTSRESIGVLDGTTQQKGLVQLSSAVNSTSDIQASTPAAVKIAMDNANARLAKDRNGADIPNVPLFLQNLGLVETIKLAAGAVAKTGDQMTGNLRIKDAGIIIETEEYDSPNIIISNTKTGADLNIDLLNDNIRIFGKASGSSVVAMLEFNLTNGILTASGGIATPESSFNKEGDVWGGKWGGWLSSWLTTQLTARDNNINLRATWEWVNQNFVNRVGRGAQASMTMDGGLVEAPWGCFLTGGNGNESNQIGIALYRPLQIFRNGVWVTIEN
ncbi:TPA: phage tail protein [Citrobacter murliniae]